MKIRTFLILLLGLALTAAAALLVIRNQELLSTPFQVTDTVQIPIYAVLGIAFLAGVVMILIGSVYRDSLEMVRRLQGFRGRKETKQLEKLYRLGAESFMEGQEEKGLVHFQAILSADPNHVDALMEAGRIQRTLKNFKEAVEYHRRARRLQPDELAPLHELVKDYETLGELDKAKVVLNRIIQIRPRKALAAYRKLRKYSIKEGDWDRAWQIQRLVESQTDKTPFKIEVERRFNVGIRYQLALAKSSEGRDRESANLLRKIVRSDPHFVPAHVRLGEVLIGIGRTNAGVEAWARGFEATGSPAFLSCMEDHFLGASEPEMAIEALRTAVARSRNDFLPRLFLARLYLRLEMIQEAHREFAGIKDRSTESPAMHALLAAVHERRGEYREAVAECQEVIRLQDLSRFLYRCSVCDARYPEWGDRCDTCLEWNQITLDFREDHAFEEIDSLSGPIYSGVP
jgi:lipopolysaccharide biosynthesis regulator YciM